MPGSRFTAVLVLILLNATGAFAQPGLNRPTPSARHVELLARPTAEMPEVRISPGIATVLLFDPAPARVEVTQRERFRAVSLDGFVLTLVPAQSLDELEQVRLTAHFDDGASPASTILLLRVVSLALAERQVEFHRRPRTVESYQQELTQLRAEYERCGHELERLRRSPVQADGFTSLLVPGHVMEAGIRVRDIVRELTPHPRNPLDAKKASTYRAATRVAVALDLTNLEAQPWQAEGASLKDKTGTLLSRVRVWQQTPVALNKPARIVVEAEAQPSEAQGPFTLSLWEADGKRTITLGNITFP